MSRTQTWTRKLLIGSTITVTLLAVAACCKDNKEETPTEESPVAEPTATEEAEKAPELGTTDPEWKTKCPDAERPESGTVTALRSLQIYKEPKTDSNKESTIGPGTWVNLLGAKGTWFCIDYPCGVGKLCPGWIEARYSKRKETVTVDAGVKTDAAAPTEVKDAAPPPKEDAAAPATDAATPKVDPGRLRIPRFNLGDAGTKTTTPPGARPPAEKPE
jgi:hypothetical protein